MKTWYGRWRPIIGSKKKKEDGGDGVQRLGTSPRRPQDDPRGGPRPFNWCIGPLITGDRKLPPGMCLRIFLLFFLFFFWFLATIAFGQMFFFSENGSFFLLPLMVDWRSEYRSGLGMPSALEGIHPKWIGRAGKKKRKRTVRKTDLKHSLFCYSKSNLPTNNEWLLNDTMIRTNMCKEEIDGKILSHQSKSEKKLEWR